MIQAAGKRSAYREKCTQVKVIQAAGKVVAHGEKCTQVKVIPDDAEQLYKQECAWMNDGEALLKAESTPLRKVFCQEQKLIHFKLFCIYRDDC